MDHFKEGKKLFQNNVFATHRQLLSGTNLFHTFIFLNFIVQPQLLPLFRLVAYQHRNDGPQHLGKLISNRNGGDLGSCREPKTELNVDPNICFSINKANIVIVTDSRSKWRRQMLLN